MGLFSKISKKAAPAPDLAVSLPPPTPVTESGTQLQQPPPPVSPLPIWLRTSGRFDVEVVGESNYFDALKRITKGASGELTLRATLVREPTNKFDSGAVRVDVEGAAVGYLARDVAPDFHGLLDAVAARGGYAVVPALVWSSGDPRNFVASVRLDVAEPASALPVNDISAGVNTRTWPEGKRVQLTDEAHHMEAIGSVLRRSYSKGQVSAWLELIAPEGSDRVEVKFDGATVGLLSGPASKKFAPHVRRVQASGSTVVCLGEIKGNSLTAEITVSLANPEDLTEDQVTALLA